MSHIKKYTLSFILAAALFTACKKSDFEKNYADPSKINTTTMPKQFAGVLTAYIGGVVPSYRHYFVVVGPTLNRYTQATGWTNAMSQYVPGSAAIQEKWDSTYNLVTQYRELQNVFNALSVSDRTANRIYMVAATIYFYDQTQKMIDLYGDIPWSAAGMLHGNGGDYKTALPKFDDATSIYTTMLDTLKSFSQELAVSKVATAIMTGFKTQDIINNGSILLWQKYCNSLRLRLLSRISDVPDLKSRANTEIAEIIHNNTQYPLLTNNADNIQIDIFDINTQVNSTGFKTGLEDWGGNLASKAMIDFMNTSADPRLRVLFEPGAKANGVYTGIDPLMAPADQSILVANGKIAIYNRSTLSRNQYFPGILMNTAEVQFLIAEAFLKEGNDADAKTAYENAIKASIDYIFKIRTLSKDATAGALVPLANNEADTYLLNPLVNWSNSLTADQKMQLIATQKWIHFNVIQPYENWSELRRLDSPSLSFWNDNSNAQSQPPVRWFYANSEKVYNPSNYSAVAPKDNLTTKIFWDLH